MVRNASGQMLIPAHLKRLITLLSSMPGIGEKTARKLAIYLYSQPDEFLYDLGNTLLHLKQNVKRCSFCNALSDTDPCVVCVDPSRSYNKLLILRSSLDRLIVEQTGVYTGFYFVLDLDSSSQSLELTKTAVKRLRKLLKYLSKHTTTGKLEVIFGFGIQFEEQQLILLLQDIIKHTLKERELEFSRFAVGIQSATDLDFMDPYTITEAYEGRRKL